MVPATDPVPVSRSLPATTPATQPVWAPSPRRVAPRWIAGRLVLAAATMLFVAMVATEGVAWLFAEHLRATMPAIDERTVISSREAYDAVERWSLLDLGLRLRVNGPLLTAVRAVGDRVIANYRREAPAVGPEEWRQAQAAFSWAGTLAPRDSSLRSKEFIADGQVRRLTAQKARPASNATAIAQTALARFRDAALADPTSPDPYIGM